jgi:hypothetical protein
MVARDGIGLGLLFAAGLGAGCTSSASLNSFEYGGSGGSQPGSALPEGGEIRHENVRLLGSQEEWLMVYQFTAPTTCTGCDTSAALAPINAILQGGSNTLKPEYGPCIDERSTGTPTGNVAGGEPSWPFSAIGSAATYETFPSGPTLTGTGISGTLDVTENNPPNTVGNSTLRSYGFTYGGGFFAGSNYATTFNGMLSPGDATAGGVYTLDVGETGGSDTSPLTYTFASEFTAPLGIGGSANVSIPNSELTVTWDAPTNVYGPNDEHVQNTYFNFMLFVDTSIPTAEFICFTALTKPGTLTVPAAVISQVAMENGGSGLIVDADLTHQMDALENPADTNHQLRRFDIVTIWCNISTFSIQ